MPRSLNDIIPPSRRRTMTDIRPAAAAQAPRPEEPRVSAPRARRRFPYGTAIIALVVVVLCGGALYAFSGAKVEITPTSTVATVSGDFVATPSTGDLPYEVVSVEKVASQSVPAESTVTANDPAQGTITIYNEQAAPQQLVNTTRFEGPNGLIFRIHSPVTVPAGSATAPGSVTATVYADAGGEQYNIGPVDRFTVPGLKGSKAYDHVYAKSTAAMTGGFSGTRPSVSQATDDKQHAELQTALASDLTAAVTAKVPEGYVFIPGGAFTSYEPQADAAGANGTVAVSIKGTLKAVVFPSEALAKAIAYKSVGTYAGEPLTVADPSKLILAPSSSTAPDGSASFDFTLSGNAPLVWSVDTAKIAGAVAGKTRDSAQVVLSGLPEVSKAVLMLRPFWTTTFPNDPSHITVTTLAPTTGGSGK